MLAGISADYYLRLEQGRDPNPSAQVLESLARVLQLDEASTAYLLSLASERPRRLRRRPRKEAVPSGIGKLLDSLPMPAFVEGRYFDVLAANPLATALSPRLMIGRNRLRDVFLDPAERSLYPTGTKPPSAWSPGSGSRSARTPTIPGSSSWWASSRSRVTASEGSGLAMTYGSATAPASRSTIRRLASPA
jgi:transcriptional regulator with XRE-family HTH domain